MRIFKSILLVIAILIAIPLVLALFISKQYDVQREVTIERPTPVVFNYVKYLRNQDNYSEWVKMDPTMKKAFRGTDGTVGFVYAWDGNSKAGKGEQEISKLTDGKRVDITVRFIKPVAGIAHTPITTEAVDGNHTRVRWEMHGTNPYPWNFMNLFMEQMLGKDLETSLTTLKEILERQHLTAAQK